MTRNAPNGTLPDIGVRIDKQLDHIECVRQRRLALELEHVGAVAPDRWTRMLKTGGKRRQVIDLETAVHPTSTADRLRGQA